jgi:hypothetical protein
MERIISLRSSVGVMGDTMTMFYTEVTDAMKTARGGGGNADEGERIEVVELSIQEARDYVSSPVVNSPAEFLFGLQWFFVNKADVLEKKSS